MKIWYNRYEWGLNMIDRYTRNVMKKIWSEENKFNKMLDVELACTLAHTKMGIVPQKDYELIKKNAVVNVDRIHEIEEVVKHDVIAFTRSISETLGDEAKWVHYGLTSTDVVDSAQSLILRDANDVIEEDLNEMIKVMKNLSLKYKDTPCIGRTHGIHAEITSFGLKMARFYAELLRDKERFLKARSNIEVIKISGAVGNYANTPMDVEEFVSKELNLKPCLISTQVLPRDLHIEYIYSLASIASTLENLAMEVRGLSRTEIDEVNEEFTPGQKGSSAMPHKKNPISSENICGLSRVVKSYINVAFDNNNLWHERDISHSSAERIILADASTLIDYMLTRYKKVMERLVVKEDHMLNNIYLTHGSIFSGRVVSALIEKGLTRETSYDMVQPLAIKSYTEHLDFETLLKSSEVNKYLNNEEIKSCFDLKYYFKEINKIYQRLGLED